MATATKPKMNLAEERYHPLLEAKMKKAERKAKIEANQTIMQSLNHRLEEVASVDLTPVIARYPRIRTEYCEKAVKKVLEENPIPKRVWDDDRKYFEITEDVEVIQPLSSTLIQAALMALEDPEGPSMVPDESDDESGGSSYMSGSGNDATATAPSCFSTTAETETTKANSHSDASVLQQEPTMAAHTDDNAQLSEEMYAADSDAE